MSGQAGYLYFDHRPVSPVAAGCVDTCLAEQGPDSASQYCGPGIFMLFRGCHFDRLSEMEVQPFASKDGLVVTFDGRLDNRNDLLIWLRDDFKGDRTDVALAAASYCRWGERGLAMLIGDWSIVIWNAAEETVLLASDYCGVRPLYYSFEDGKGAVWSSSLSSLVQHLRSVEALDQGWIAAFLTARPQFDHTIYRQIRAVPPAHAVCIRNNNLSVSRFWSPHFLDSTHFESEARYEEELLHPFREAVAVRLRSNRPVALDLTGGLDSSSVTCMAHDLVTSGSVEATQLFAVTELDHCSDDERYASVIQQRLCIRQVCFDMKGLWSLTPYQSRPMLKIPRRRCRGEVIRREQARVNLSGIPGDFIMGNEVDDCGQLADYLRDFNLHAFITGAYAWSRALRVPIWHVFRRSLIPFLGGNRQWLTWQRQRVSEGNAYSHLDNQHNCWSRATLLSAEDDLRDRVHVSSWGPVQSLQYDDLVPRWNISRWVAPWRHPKKLSQRASHTLIYIGPWLSSYAQSRESSSVGPVGQDIS